MDQTQQREQKWGFWIYMLNFLNLDSICRLLIRKTLHIDEIQFIHHLISFGIAFSLTIGLFFAVRPYAWKYRMWVTGAILAAWLSAHILFAVK